MRPKSKRTRPYLTICAIAFCVCLIPIQNQSALGESSGCVIEDDCSTDDIPLLPISTIVENHEEYSGKLVRTWAYYRLGFEWSEFYAEESPASVNADFDTYCEIQERCSNKKADESIRLDSTMGVVVVGIFQSGNKYGHMGGWDHQLSVLCIDDVVVFSKESSIQPKLPAPIQREMKRWWESMEVRRKKEME